MAWRTAAPRLALCVSDGRSFHGACKRPASVRRLVSTPRGQLDTRGQALSPEKGPAPARYERKTRHRDAVKRGKRRRLVDSGIAVDLDPASPVFDQDLLAEIKGAKGARTLSKIFSQYAVNMSADALVAMLAAFAKVARSSRPRPSAEQLAALALPASQVLQAALPQVTAFSPCQLGAASEALGHLRLYSQPFMAALCSRAATLLSPAPAPASPASLPSGTSTMPSGTLPTGRPPHAATSPAPTRGLHHAPPTSAPSAGRLAPPPGPDQHDRTQQRNVASGAAAASVPAAAWEPARRQRQRFSPEAIAGLLHGLAVHRHQPQAHLRERLLQAALQLLPKMDAQHLAKVVYAMAVLQWHLPSSWLDAAMSAFRLHMGTHSCHAPSVTKFLHAMVLLGARPSFNWLMAYSAEARRKLDYQGPDEMVAVLWAFAKLGFVPDGVYMECWFLAVARKLDQLDAQGVLQAARVLAVMDWGTRLRVDWVPGKFRAALLQHAAGLIDKMEREQLVELGWALVEVRIMPGADWMHSWAEAVSPLVSQLSGHECADLAYVAAEWSGQFEFGDEFWGALAGRLREVEGCLSARDVARAVHGLKVNGYMLDSLEHTLLGMAAEPWATL